MRGFNKPKIQTAPAGTAQDAVSAAVTAQGQAPIPKVIPNNPNAVTAELPKTPASNETKVVLARTEVLLDQLNARLETLPPDSPDALKIHRWKNELEAIESFLIEVLPK